jgi:hypothetical protein
VIEELIAEVAREGERRHGSWNREVFAKWAAEARQLDVKIARAYLEMVREGIAVGLLKNARTPTLLELALYRAPAELSSLPPKKAIELLAAAWNLAEGLHDEPAWMNDYVLSRRGELQSIAEMPAWLKRILQPVLEDNEASTFTKNFAVQVIDFRPLAPAFLPGEMSLLAPRVLAVRDRDDSAELCVLLQHGQKSTVTGVLNRSGDPSFESAAQLPQVTVTGSAVRVGATEVLLPLLVSPHQHRVVPAGFIAISAVDSQRLWIVESR